MLPRNIRGSETHLFDLTKGLLGILSKSSFLGSGWGRIKSKIVEKHMQAHDFKDNRKMGWWQRTDQEQGEVCFVWLYKYMFIF